MTEPEAFPAHDPAAPLVKVEDDRTGLDPVTLERAILDHLYYTCGKDLRGANLHDLYTAVAHMVRDRLLNRWLKTRRTYFERDVKRAYYLSAEYLLGRALKQDLHNLGIYDHLADGLARRGIALEQVLEQEPDPGLGNGGLGRLAACFLESLATLGMPGFGYGIRYEYGIFEQTVVDGWQVERRDAWLRHGNPWELMRPEYTQRVNFYGRTEQYRRDDGSLRVRWVDAQRILGVPYDVPISGYGARTVNSLRLWAARASSDFNLQHFNAGDYRRAVEEKVTSETISKVLYPNDQSPEGRELRLKQQYFFVCCSIHDLIRRYKKQNTTFDAFADKVAIQLNDTHPAIAVAELMRVLVDEEDLPWDIAWRLTQNTLSYTNHTLLPEALEAWPLDMFGRLLPRHLSIIFEINHRFMRQVHIFSSGDDERKARMSLIAEGPDRKIRMAHLAVVGCHSVNGVSQMHSDLVKHELFPDFFEMWPERFNNKTNGVTPRRFLLYANPTLARIITARIGREWVVDMSQLERLRPLADDPSFLEELRQAREENKRKLADIIAATCGIEVDPGSMFVSHIKRIHEYKRQLMAALHIVALYRQLKQEQRAQVVPRTFIFAGKAAPGYAIAKLIIKLINDIAAVVNDDPMMSGRLSVVFVPNYNVSLAERIIPATDVSLQISQAGTEASGTGNMKFAMNGALTVGTLDGANVEIRNAVGAEHFFHFGLSVEEVRALARSDYRPGDYIEQSEALRDALDFIASGFFSPNEPARFAPIIDQLRHRDPFMICADFAAYMRCHEELAALYRRPDEWMRKAVYNLAASGRFSSDRTIAEYADDIWGIEKIPVDFSLTLGPPAATAR